ncbi:hypothetical protein NPIL_300371 [Nephila pilipes]|uniref:Uncharacterized protein n=1 Tax=Nephila pilipes TaxID=299642 RepID=A0A8X6P313_NEPPI|nr:hypothetical protein NPIL_300371 [Nephila pilipes]
MEHSPHPLELKRDKSTQLKTTDETGDNSEQRQGADRQAGNRSRKGRAGDSSSDTDETSRQERQEAKTSSTATKAADDHTRPGSEISRRQRQQQETAARQHQQQGETGSKCSPKKPTDARQRGHQLKLGGATVSHQTNRKLNSSLSWLFSTVSDQKGPAILPDERDR